MIYDILCHVTLSYHIMSYRTYTSLHVGKIFRTCEWDKNVTLESLITVMHGWQLNF